MLFLWREEDKITHATVTTWPDGKRSRLECPVPFQELIGYRVEVRCMSSIERLSSLRRSRPRKRCMPGMCSFGR